MNQAEAIEQISKALSHFTSQLAQENFAGFFSKNRLLEDLLLPAFSLILQAPALRNLNGAGQNNAYLDLGDDKKRVGVQVTTEHDAAKITKTLEGVRDTQLYDKYDRIVIFLLQGSRPKFTKKTKDGWTAICGTKLRFVPEQDVISLPQLLSLIGARPFSEIIKIQELFARNILGEDGLTINLNHPHRRQGKPEKLIDLLNPFIRATPFVGRESDIGELESWLASDRNISVRCVIGKGGTGKTRLGIEICAAAEKRNWFAGFVTSEELSRFAAAHSLSNWSWSKDTLVVIDYAAARASILRKWLNSLSHNVTSSGKRLRLLLLERHADRKSGWWHDMVTPGTFSEQQVTALLDPPVPVTLPSIVTPDHLRNILANVMDEASRLVGKPLAIKPPSPGENLEFDRKLADPSANFAPLYLTMAGVTAVQEGIPTLLTRGSCEMAQRIASDELSRIAKLAIDRNVNPDLLKYLAVGITLAGGCSRDELLDYIAEERAALGYGQQDDQRVGEAVSDALSVQHERISPILPDLIGEGTILEQVVKLSKQKQGAFVRRWFTRARSQVAAILVRLARDYSTSTVPLHLLDALIEGNQDHLQNLEEISAQIPYSFRLRDRSVKISELIINILNAGLSSSITQQAQKPALARALNTLAERLSAVGKDTESVARSQESVDIWRELASTQSGAYLPLATSLNTLAVMLSKVGRLEDAVVRAEESVDILVKLAKQTHALVHTYVPTIRASLALSLNTLANRLSAVGRRTDALAPAQESVRLYRELMAAHLEFGPWLAMSLNTLATSLIRLGSPADALAASQEAVRLYRELAAPLPDAFRPRLALSLNNLANRLLDAGRPAEALPNVEEAVKIRRELAKSHPDVFRPYLATSIMNLAVVLSRLEQPAQALSRYEDAFDLYRELAAAQADAFRPQLAMTLNNIASTLRVLGRDRDSLARAQEAVDLYRKLAVIRPEAFIPDLARALNLQANCLESLSMFDAALRADEEATAHLGQSFCSTPVPFIDLMSKIVFDYARRLNSLSVTRRPDQLVLLNRILEVLNRELALRARPPLILHVTARP